MHVAVHFVLWKDSAQAYAESISPTPDRKHARRLQLAHRNWEVRPEEVDKTFIIEALRTVLRDLEADLGT